MKIKNSATWKELLGIELFNRFPAGPMALAFWNTRLDWHPRKKRNNPHSAQKKSPKKTTVVQSGERRSPRYDGCQRDKPATGGRGGLRESRSVKWTNVRSDEAAVRAPPITHSDKYNAWLRDQVLLSLGKLQDVSDAGVPLPCHSLALRVHLKRGHLQGRGSRLQAHHRTFKTEVENKMLLKYSLTFWVAFLVRTLKTNQNNVFYWRPIFLTFLYLHYS